MPGTELFFNYGEHFLKELPHAFETQEDKVSKHVAQATSRKSVHGNEVGEDSTDESENEDSDNDDDLEAILEKVQAPPNDEGQDDYYSE